MFITSSLRAQNGCRFPPRAISLNGFIYCLSGFDLLPSLQRCTTILRISSKAVLLFIVSSFCLAYLHAHHILTATNYMHKSLLNCCSCLQGDQRDVWNEEAFCKRIQISRRLIVSFKPAAAAAGGAGLAVVHSRVGWILTQYLCAR